MFFVQFIMLRTFNRVWSIQNENIYLYMESYILSTFGWQNKQILN